MSKSKRNGNGREREPGNGAAQQPPKLRRFWVDGAIALQETVHNTDRTTWEFTTQIGGGRFDAMLSVQCGPYGWDWSVRVSSSGGGAGTERTSYFSRSGCADSMEEAAQKVVQRFYDTEAIIGMACRAFDGPKWQPKDVELEPEPEPEVEERPLRRTPPPAHARNGAAAAG